MKFYNLFFFLFSSIIFNSNADHIVGGELQLVHKSGDKYSVALNFYFNDITGDHHAIDPQAYVSIFSKRTNKLLQTIYLPLLSDDFIPNLGAGVCTNGNVRTKLLKYMADVTLSSSIYSDTVGYYMSWERCCRNHTIDNLENPDETGITIYLEFPAVSKSSSPFINSSPTFNALQNIYGCKGKPFYFDFAATDKDGDSLVYFLKTPLKGHSTIDPSNTAPVGNPAPYDSVIWKTGYDLTNAIHGNPSLEIDKNTGRLFVIPSEAGLFVFAVFCEEYRNGKKIGVVSRDFQFFIDNCPPLYPPQITMTLPDNNTYKEKDTIRIDLKQQYCFDLSVVDSTWNLLNQAEPITFLGSGKTQPNISVTIDSPTLTINGTNPVEKNRICISSTCKNGQYNYAGLYEYQILVSDKSCPVPLLDTLTITFYLNPIPNNKPKIYPALSINEDVHIGTSYSLVISGTDKDVQDRITLSMAGSKASGMSFPIVLGQDSITSLFTWTPQCEELNQSQSYKTLFFAKDDHCLFPSSDTLEADFTITEIVEPFNFHAPNLITANGDVYNQCFEIPDLPVDNCANYFKKLEIYNRWGTKIFESEQRQFKWNPKDESEGLYFYVLTYSSKEYKSWIQVIK